jgi:hypothetical protein
MERWLLPILTGIALAGCMAGGEDVARVESDDAQGNETDSAECDGSGTLRGSVSVPEGVYVQVLDGNGTTVFDGNFTTGDLSEDLQGDPGDWQLRVVSRDNGTQGPDGTQSGDNAGATGGAGTSPDTLGNGTRDDIGRRTASPTPPTQLGDDASAGTTPAGGERTAEGGSTDATGSTGEAAGAYDVTLRC